ncbi:alpha-2-macroglobulin receptor-associated protein [Condylostylus longicornis]|uniref:alpha-2-macroglobulin receptor-associated protein n=1 Tax=Condylostylus longicornis TaxID=2530218 RepID=UPI00244DD159|nr:alpha-2-macroglobulin receptor-associated protein [Condylostylus longicornis]XP_055381322.1 alpha-2-macroglobulin receptor-associated protein [Condylostylus longicornis]
MNKNIKKVSVLIIFLILVQASTCDKKQKNKYSKEYNTNIFDSEKYDPEIRDLKNPFRMGKLNLVWEKAKHRLTEPKLKSLYTELKIQDKEELAWKELNSQHKDKDGIKAAELRHKLIGIMSTYDLLEHFEDTQDPVKTKPYKKFHDKNDNNYMNKSLFKDKKLNRLWEKAEISGFSAEELKTLKEEFQHHQDKIDLYYSLLEEIGSETRKTEQHENAVNEDELEIFNEITNLDNNEIPGADKHNDYSGNINKLRDTHREIKDHYERLERLTARGPNSQEFIEPKVQGLWRVAMASNFTEKELDSIKHELRHFESRLIKLRHLHADYALTKEKHKREKSNDKHDKFQEMNDHIKKQTRKVEKLQDDLEKMIFKHTEL